MRRDEARLQDILDEITAVESYPNQGRKSRYPDNWPEIALSIKQREGWHCYRCGVRGLRPGEKLFSAKDRAFLIQVHHWDGDPGNNSPDNLVALCKVCHLYMHRQRHGSIAIGQCVLPFDIEQRFLGRSAPRIPLAVQLGLWRDCSGYRQLELWDLYPENCWETPRSVYGGE